MYKHIIFFLMVFFYGILRAEDTHFSSELLRNTVAKLQCQHQIDSVSNGISIISLPDGKKLRVEKRNGNLVNIGLPLFDNQFLYLHYPLFSYIEFSALDHEYHISDNPFLYRVFTFINGDWSLLSKVNPSVSPTVEIVENEFSLVEWRWDDHLVLTIKCEFDYARLALMSRTEIENLILSEMKSFHKMQDTKCSCSVDESDLILIDSLHWVLPGESFFLKNINQNTYYQKENDYPTLVCDSNLLPHTIANLVNNNSQMPIDPQITIVAQKYGFEKDTLSISFRDFIGFCQRDGNVLYCGFESQSERSVVGSVYIVNHAVGYLHLLKMQATLAENQIDNIILTGQLSLYIPINRVETMY